MSQALLKQYAAKLKSIRWSDEFIRRNPVYYRRISKIFESLKRMGLEERKAWTAERLRIVLERAGKTRYGRQTGARPDSIEAWPYLLKREVQNDPMAFVQSPVMMTFPTATSGSTGTPLKLYRSPLSVVVEQLCIDSLTASKARPPHKMKTAIFRGDDIKDPSDLTPPFWRYTHGGRKLVFSSVHLSIHTAEHFFNELEAFSPECMMAYPNVLDYLCGLLERLDRKTSVPLVLTSSNVLSSLSRERAERWLGCEVIDYYGQAERVAFAYSYADGEYYFLPGYAHVELEYAHTEEAFDYYEIVGTSLWNAAMPLVRYRTGDLIQLPKGAGTAERELIRYGLLPFSRVIGRVTDFIYAPDGARVIGINHIPRGVENINQMQVIQDVREAVRLLVIPGKHFSEKDRDQIISNAYRKLPRTMRVEVELVERLQTTPAGKTPFIIRNGVAE